MMNPSTAVLLLAGACCAAAVSCNAPDTSPPDLPLATSLQLVVQVVNDSGGAATATDFTVGADGPTPISGAGTAVSDGSFQPGSYALRVTTLNVYAAADWTCVGASLEAGNIVTLNAGATATCTITENDIPASLTLAKHVTNDNRGTAQPTDFTLAATGPTPLSGTGIVVSPTSFQPGTYTLSSTALPGYTSGSWSCTGVSLGAGDTITLHFGDAAVCSTTDDDIATILTLADQVLNDNAGAALVADFTLTASGPTPITGPGQAASDANFAEGSYTLSESGPSGYTSGVWSCTGGSLAGDVLTIALGETVACSITNDDDLVPLVVSSNTAVTNDAAVQQMPSVAVDSQNTDHVAVAYMDYSLPATGFAGIGVAMSTDGGSNWTRTEVPLPAGLSQAAGHPVAKFYQGKLYVAFMATTFLGPLPGLIYDPRTFLGVSGRSFGMQANNGIFVARSDDGGTTWNPATAVASNLFGGITKVPFETTPDFAIDLSTGASAGTFYVTWTRFYPATQYPGNAASTGGSAVMLARSTDGGQNWTTSAQGGVSAIQDPIVPTPGAGTEGNGYYLSPRVSVGPEGDVYVSLYAGGYIAIFHSTDNGVTFVAPNTDPVNPSGRPFGLEVVAGSGSGSFDPSPTLPNNSFRTLPVRAIAADPVRPGHVYFAEAVQTYANGTGLAIDGNINFARSEDYGVTWEQLFTLGSQAPQIGELPIDQQFLFRSPLNDDDGNRFLSFDTDLADEVISGQALPELSVDAQGNIMVLWYDTRRDPANHSLDVFASISTDGGQSFSANHRVTQVSFDASAGAFVDATGAQSFYLGDRLGLGMAGGTAYIAWTDTQSGNQEIVMSRSALSPPPAAPNDRYEPNETPAEALDLGSIVAQLIVPRLVMVGGENDWFRIEAGLTGTLTVTATAAAGADALQLDLWDVTGTSTLAAGQPIANGQQVSFGVTSGEVYLVRARKQASSASVPYTLTLSE